MIKIIRKRISRAPIYHTGRFTIRDIQKFVFQTISRLDAKLTYHLEVVVFIIIIFFYYIFGVICSDCSSVFVLCF